MEKRKDSSKQRKKSSRITDSDKGKPKKFLKRDSDKNDNPVKKSSGSENDTEKKQRNFDTARQFDKRPYKGNRDSGSRPYSERKSTDTASGETYAKRPYKRRDDAHTSEGKSSSEGKGKDFSSGGFGEKRPYKRRDDANKSGSGHFSQRNKQGTSSGGFGAKRSFVQRENTQPKEYSADQHQAAHSEQSEHRLYKTPGAYREYKKNKDLIRLNKLISNSGYCSRRDADILISAGSVTVDGKTVTELGFKVNIHALVKIDNQPVKIEKFQYILLNKPKDVITTCDDPQGRMTVLHLIKGACKERVYPVGRLDRNTTGLLILTNDGDFAKKVAHPSSKIKKLYEVTLDKKLKQEHFDEISKGVWLDENTFVDVDDLAFAEGPKSGTVLGIEIHSGKYHVVKRIFEKFGYIVTKLDRTKIDILTKKELPRGRWRFMTESEIQLLKRY